MSSPTRTRLPHQHCYGRNSAFTQLISICLIQSMGHTRKSRDLKRKAHNFHGNQEYILLVNGAQVCVLSYFRQFPTRVMARHIQKQNQSPTTNWPLTTGKLGPKKKTQRLTALPSNFTSQSQQTETFPSAPSHLSHKKEGHHHHHTSQNADRNAWMMER